MRKYKIPDCVGVFELRAILAGYFEALEEMRERNKFLEFENKRLQAIIENKKMPC